MFFYRSTLKDRWLRLTFIPLLTIVFPLLMYGPGDDRLPYSFISTLISCVIIWEGNRFFLLKLRGWLTWERWPWLHLTAQVVACITFTAFIVWLSFHISYDLIYHMPLDHSIYLQARGFAVVLALMLNAIYEGMYFAERWRQTLTRAEVLKRESIRSQFQSLKNQVSPHFLFNSLNTLATLIEEDDALAQRFVLKLSAVYRYVLESKDQTTVSLEEEVKFVKAYIFLLQMRFGDNLHVHFDLEDQDLHSRIPPITLQILVENAVKHNIVGKEKPLHIHIKMEYGQLRVWNNLQRKNSREDSTRVGLQNIRERFSYLTEKRVVVEESTERFEVRLPLLA